MPKIKDQPYVINLDEHISIGTNWRALYVNGDNVTYFDSFRVQHIPKEIKNIIDNKNITRNIYKMQANVSIMFGYFCIRFIDFMIKGKTFLDYTNLFSFKE